MRSLLKTITLTALTFTAMTGLAFALEKETSTRTYSYDYNKDGIIEPDEFTTYIYERSDLDGDGYLGDEEWNLARVGWNRSYKDIDFNQYTYWDQDKDGHLDSNEIKTLVQKTGLYSKWDTDLDGKVNSEEFAKGTFNAYDDNNDNMLSLDEWKSVLR